MLFIVHYQPMFKDSWLCSAGFMGWRSEWVWQALRLFCSVKECLIYVRSGPGAAMRRRDHRFIGVNLTHGCLRKAAKLITRWDRVSCLTARTFIFQAAIVSALRILSCFGLVFFSGFVAVLFLGFVAKQSDQSLPRFSDSLRNFFEVRHIKFTVCTHSLGST